MVRKGRRHPAEEKLVMDMRQALLRRASTLEADYWGTDPLWKGHVRLMLALAEWDAGDWIEAQMKAADGQEPLHG